MCFSKKLIFLILLVRIVSPVTDVIVLCVTSKSLLQLKVNDGIVTLVTVPHKICQACQHIADEQD